jgi:hypothetical protein
MHLTEGYYEIIGSVKDDKSVKALTSIELGPNLGKCSTVLPIIQSYYILYIAAYMIIFRLSYLMPYSAPSTWFGHVQELISRYGSSQRSRRTRTNGEGTRCPRIGSRRRLSTNRSWQDSREKNERIRRRNRVRQFLAIHHHI